ncbi:MAG: cytochrome, partial [Bacteroidota bacterium]
MPQKIIIGVMGPGEGAKPEACATAYQLGRLLASKGWITLCGGRKAGVMEAVSRGAKEAGGITVGILPGEDNQQTSEH